MEFSWMKFSWNEGVSLTGVLLSGLDFPAGSQMHARTDHGDIARGLAYGRALSTW